MKKHFDYLSTLPGIGDVIRKLRANNYVFPERMIYHFAFFNCGYLSFHTHEEVLEAHDIFKRFAKVFQQTYTRFLDLKKAEAQAREAQIEAALERVRGRSMAMHKSEELADLSLELVGQVQKLGISTWFCAFNIYDDDEKGSLEWGSNGQGVFPKYRTPREGIFLEYYEVGQSGEILLIRETDEKACPAHYEYLCSLPGVGEQLLKMKATGISFPTSQIDHVAFFKYGYIIFITFDPAPEAHNIFKRFAKVFEQTYTRFLDLKKAEAQAREAQIEVALERTRTQSMLMQHSDELDKTIQVFHEQLHLLGIASEFSYLWLPDEDKSTHLFWATWFENQVNKKEKLEGSPNMKTKSVVYPLDKTEPSIAECYVAWESGETIHVNPITPEGVKDYFNTWEELLRGADQFKAENYQDGVYYVDAYMKYGCFGIMIRTLLSEDEKNILSRFTKEFERAYTRFLDLQKAEAQAREAQINLSVERVRAKALAMHKSEEILEVVGTLKDEVMALDIPDVIAATIFLDEGHDKVRMWELSSLEKVNDGYQLPFDITFNLKKRDPNLYVKRIWENPESYFLEMQNEKDFERYVEWLRENDKTSVGDKIEKYIEQTQLKQLHHVVKKLNNGKLVIDLLNLPSDEMESILTKIGAAFDLAYTRFIDLKKQKHKLGKLKLKQL
ncbi:MAG: hypothetical protein IPL46_22100 [Saprospiraceae bacterium]|nr:hypothetical protein [Saprospiraceae bacterium]